MRDPSTLRKKLVSKVESLPDGQLRLVLDFIASLETKNGENDPILHVAGSLSGEPLSAKEIEEELYGRK